MLAAYGAEKNFAGCSLILNLNASGKIFFCDIYTTTQPSSFLGSFVLNAEIRECRLLLTRYFAE
jgi:hypothetical protein